MITAAPADVLDKTLPQLLRARARGPSRQRPALRHKEFGIWNEITWETYYEKVRLTALGLKAIGLRPGETVAVIADNIPEWFYTELAVQAVGAVVVGIYQSSVSDEVAFGVQATDAAYVVAEDQEQVDKLLEVRDQIPTVRRVIFEDPRGMRRYRDDPWLMSFEELLELGADPGSLPEPFDFEASVDAGRPQDVALMCFSSGTTDRPKPVMLTHKNMTFMGYHFATVEGFRPTDDYLSFLPLAWMGEQTIAVFTSLVAGFTVNFPEEVETIDEDLREIGPHLIFSPPRVWEAYMRNIRVRIEDSTWLKRFVFRHGFRIGMAAADLELAGQPVPRHLRVLRRLFHFLLFRLIQDRFGLLRLRKAYTAGAALGPDVFRFFHALGVNLKQGYGQTETAGIFCFHRDNDIKFETVGPPSPTSKYALATGARCSSGPTASLLVTTRDEDTKNAFEDGWLRSGDAGYLDDDGHLVIIDRLDDVMHTQQGEVFSPQFIENKLKFSHYINEAVVFGDDLPYIAALINIDPRTVGKWAEDRRISYTTYMDLSQKPEVADLIKAEVAHVNESLKPEHRIRKFALLYKLLDADDDELTRTGKVRRNFIAQRYKDLFDALYDGRASTLARTTFHYQDGRVAEVELTVDIHGMSEEAVADDGLRVAAAR